MPIIFRGQHDAFLKKLNTKDKPIGTFHEQMARRLTADHMEPSRHEYISNYRYEALRQGIFCEKCAAPFTPTPSKYFVCEGCGIVESTELALLRTAHDFRLLFPESQRTVSGIWDWTNGIVSKSTIRRNLSKHFLRKSSGRGTYYC